MKDKTGPSSPAPGHRRAILTEGTGSSTKSATHARTHTPNRLQHIGVGRGSLAIVRVVTLSAKTQRQGRRKERVDRRKSSFYSVTPMILIGCLYLERGSAPGACGLRDDALGHWGLGVTGRRQRLKHALLVRRRGPIQERSCSSFAPPA
ncbi:hypothetical protein LIA77_10551 [Sarocladium implicatum]|nr:hypothetical protein LIA77_10551 [Sarocladium implicatum]